MLACVAGARKRKGEGKSPFSFLAPATQAIVMYRSVPYIVLWLHINIKEQMLLTAIRKCWVVQRNTVILKQLLKLQLDITNILVVFPQFRYIEVFDITNKFPQSLGTSLKPHPHEQIFCDNFYVTTFICPCT